MENTSSERELSNSDGCNHSPMREKHQKWSIALSHGQRGRPLEDGVWQNLSARRCESFDGKSRLADCRFAGTAPWQNPAINERFRRLEAEAPDCAALSRTKAAVRKIPKLFGYVVRFVGMGTPRCFDCCSTSIPLPGFTELGVLFNPNKFCSHLRGCINADLVLEFFGDCFLRGDDCLATNCGRVEADGGLVICLGQEYE